MRVTAFILGLIASIGAFFESMLGGFLLGVAADFGENSQKVSNAQGAAAVGILFPILGIIGAALAFKYPKASFILLSITAFSTIIAGSTTSYQDLIFWGIMFAIAAIFSMISGIKSKKTHVVSEN